MTRSIIFLFLILFLTLAPISATAEQLDIHIEFPDFYEINVTAKSCCKVIGLVGVNYTVNATVGAPNKEVNLTNRYMLIDCFHKDEKELDTDKVFIFNNIDCYRLLSHRLNLSDELKTTSLSKGEYKNFSFSIFFYETGLYDLRWKESGESRDSVRVISIISPIEYENLLKQAQVLDAQKKSAEASEKSAKASEKTANATKWLAFGTAALAFLTFVTVTLIRKDREVDLLRRRLGNLYSMLKRNKDILNQKPPLDSRHAKRHAKYVLWMPFYTKFKENLYLASDELVLVAEKFLEYIDLNRVPEEKEKEFYEIRRNLIEQIDSDYDKYLKLLTLTEKLALSHFLLKITRFLDGAKKLLKLTEKPKK